MPAGALSLAVAVMLLVGLTVALSTSARLGLGRDAVVASVRAVVQLFVVGLVIKVVFTTPALAFVYIPTMLTAAAYTSARRLGVGRTFHAAAAAIACGAAVVAVIVFATGALPFDARNGVPFTAQVIGGAMTATTLAALRLRDEIWQQWDVVEGWLALGATPQQAVAELGRFAAARSLVPALDQTRNVGLVVLPGAFVGLLLGGATPLQAGRLQLLVLIGLLAAETVAALVVTRLLGVRIAQSRPTRVP